MLRLLLTIWTSAMTSKTISTIPHGPHAKGLLKPCIRLSGPKHPPKRKKKVPSRRMGAMRMRLHMAIREE